MSTAALKIDLINQITGITDKARLKELLQLLHFQSDASVYITTKEEKAAIAAARRQIENGTIISNAAVQKDISQSLLSDKKIRVV